jgi:hypothetical protein
MPAVFTQPVNRLAKRIGNKGVGRPQAIAAADENIESIREEAVADIDEQLSQINRLFSSWAPGATPPVEPLYEASDMIAGSAGVFGLPHLGTAAYSLCELLTFQDDPSKINREAVKVHLDAMHVIRLVSNRGQDEAIDTILNDLASLLRHVGAKASAEQG